MSNLFNHFTIVSNIVKHISWNDINNFKKLNSLCSEVCEREEIRRCFGIQFGCEKLEKVTVKASKRRKLDSSYLHVLSKVNIQCKNPKLVLIMSNIKEKAQLKNIVMSQCDSSSTVLCVYSKHGTMGCTSTAADARVKFVSSFSQQTPAISWLCLPHEVDAEILTPDSEIGTSTKLVIVMNVSRCRDFYRTSVFPDFEEAGLSNPVIYSGGLVNGIEIFNRDKRCFDKLDSISIAIGGDDCIVDRCVFRDEMQMLDSGPSDADRIGHALAGMKARSEEVARRHPVKYQCILIFSCFVRQANEWPSLSGSAEAAVTEYELCSQYFPGVPISGLLCEGEIFHVHNGVLKLVKGLYMDDIDGNTSIILLLTWTKTAGQ